jgi:hypothetical protein
VAGTSFTIRRPWVEAFGFGLLHGFGFAGALAEIGLPPQDTAVAFAMFNVDVEGGQTAFRRRAAACSRREAVLTMLAAPRPPCCPLATRIPL